MNRDSVVTRQNSSPLPLAFKAGPLALDILQREGLSPHSLGAVAGAAGGPKWLVLAAMDKLIFGSWLAQRKTPLPLIGSSIGSWRFAAATQRSPVDAITTLATLYVEQQYSDHPTITEVTEVARNIVEQLLGNNGAEATLGHDWARLNIITAHCQGATSSDKRARLVMALAKPSSQICYQGIVYLSICIDMFSQIPDTVLLISHFPVSTLTCRRLRRAI